MVSKGTAILTNQSQLRGGKKKKEKVSDFGVISNTQNALKNVAHNVAKIVLKVKICESECRTVL